MFVDLHVKIVRYRDYIQHQYVYYIVDAATPLFPYAVFSLMATINSAFRAETIPKKKNKFPNDMHDDINQAFCVDSVTDDVCFLDADFD